ncbi:membrane protein [Streptomyces fumigatiscleroticus]|nr:membrane protein [Streptomyces fumigatiscleroticus]
MHLYEERLGVPAAWFGFAFLLGLAVAAILLPFGPAVALGGLVLVTSVTALAVRHYGSVRITVTTGHLTAGKVRIPLASLGLAEILDSEEAFAWRTRRADPHALMLLRSYVPTALRIEIRDAGHPAPYAYLSTRQPTTLMAVLAFARR